MTTIKLPRGFLEDFQLNQVPFMSLRSKDLKAKTHPDLGEFSVRLVDRPERGYWTVEMNDAMAAYALAISLGRHINGEPWLRASAAAEKRLRGAGITEDTDIYRRIADAITKGTNE